MAPRLRIGVLGDITGLSRELAHAGHQVAPLRTLEQAADCDAIVLEGDNPSWITDMASALAVYIQPRQLVIHTALAHGAQLLDAVETRGAIVMCAYNIFGDHWVTAAADEIGETVISLLLSEFGGISHPITDDARPRVAAAVQLRFLEHTVRTDSFELLRSAIGAVDAFEEEYFTGAPPAGVIVPSEELERMHRAIDDPATARIFVDLLRRTAERAGDADAELWAIAKGRSER